MRFHELSHHLERWYNFIFHFQVKKTKSKTYGTRSASRRKQKQQPVAPPQNDKTVKQMLGELYGDKMYLEKLMKEIGKEICFSFLFSFFLYCFSHSYFLG